MFKYSILFKNKITLSAYPNRLFHYAQAWELLLTYVPWNTNGQNRYVSKRKGGFV
jgi:hypothetical protein